MTARRTDGSIQLGSSPVEGDAGSRQQMHFAGVGGDDIEFLIETGWLLEEHTAGGRITGPP
jgi:hypothetical protein